MSKLPNAPLVEVIFEIRWNFNPEITDLVAVTDCLYDMFKSDLPHREYSTMPLPPGVTLPMRLEKTYFRKERGGYPLVQVAPGIVSVNTVDAEYEWEDFACLAESVMERLEGCKEVAGNMAGVSLKYLDFYEFDFEHGNVFDFVNENFCLRLGNDAASNMRPLGINVQSDYRTRLGIFSVNISRGGVGGKVGLVMNTSVSLGYPVLHTGKLKEWLDGAHETLSNYFKKVTEGRMYNSFK